ncbi:MAG: substrate-binding periplasmic protein [Rhodoferax sp.]
MGLRSVRVAVLVAVSMVAGPLALAQSLLKIQYNERVPYQVTQDNGTVTGLTATPIARALLEAGIPHQWEKVPTNRQLANIKANTDTVCGVGWFQNPERLQFAKFSRPVYRDQPTVLLARSGFAVPERSTLEAVLARPGVRVLVKDNYSYGPFIDGLLARLQPHLVKTTSENAAMVAMVRLERADFMFISEEEAPVVMAEAGLAPKDLQIARAADMPKGERRHLMCSPLVSDDTLRRLNQALAPLVAGVQ